MKTNQSPEEDGGLRELLREWKVATPLPPRFKEGVWRRIEQAERKPEPRVWARLAGVLEVFLPRPKYAFAYVSVLLALGVMGGTFAAQATTKRLNTDLGVRYVQSVDPYQKAGVGQ